MTTIEDLYPTDKIHEVMDFVRANHCEECRDGRGRCDESMELDCYSFMDEVERILKEESA